MSEHDLFWRYDDLSELIAQLPSEEIAVHFAEHEDGYGYIVFAASLHEIKEYPQEVGNTIILGPGVVRKGRMIETNGELFGAYPFKVGDVTVLGPKVFRHDNLVTVGDVEYQRICGKKVAELPNDRHSLCWLPLGHHANLHEDKDGKTRYA